MNITEVDNRSKLLCLLSSAFSINLIGGVCLAVVQTPSRATHPVRPTPPTRDPHTPGYVTAKELPDGTNPPVNADGNFIIGPTYDPVRDMSLREGVLEGAVFDFTMDSIESKMYPGIAREPDTFGTPDPTDLAKLMVTTSHPAPYTRKVTVYIPRQYIPGSVAPFIVGADGPDRELFATLDNRASSAGDDRGRH